MSARIWHERRRNLRIDRFALAVIDRETAETPDELRLAERRVRRASHLLAIVEAPRWRRD